MSNLLSLSIEVPGIGKLKVTPQLLREQTFDPKLYFAPSYSDRAILARTSVCSIV